MFQTAEENFIIAEVPGISGYLVLYGFSLTFAGSVLCSLRLIFQAVDRVLNIAGKLLGFVAALLFVPLQAALHRPVLAVLQRLLLIWNRVKPVGAKICVRVTSVVKRYSIKIAVKLKLAFLYARNKLTPIASPVIRLLRSRFFPIFAFVVLFLTAVITFFQTKLAAVSTFTLTKLAAVLIVCSPRLYAMIESVRPLLTDRAALLKVSRQFGLRQRDAIVLYSVRLVKPSFEWTLKYIRTKTSRCRRIKVSKTRPLNGVVVH
ncbi:hypothetical protein ElyMa_002471100 [Elysia marginata]|uniref:Uncharacterized protein n=1 Tax=Elysia marginata TaxID=1093978 RepID=A0AAV4GNH3_9GAST|nr:hypothetical protein ElyMa_002471100 [Elysia marginata]